MSSMTRLNSSAATLTKNRTEGSVTSVSGMCVTCVDGCIGLCEIGKSAYRGREVLYPQPFGITTSASEKRYPLDYSHLAIMTTAVGAQGIAPDVDTAVFPNVDLGVRLGRDRGLSVRLPWLVSALGATAVASNNWTGIAIGAALAGVAVTVGENVAGMDPEAVMRDGRVVDTVDLKRRVSLYQKAQRDGDGAIIVQANLEDTRLGVPQYAIEKLGVTCVELKWGQGASALGGAVKIDDLKQAQMIHQRGYLVLPNPTDPQVIEAFRHGGFKEFEGHSRVDMVSEESFARRVEELRAAGARCIFLKTGAFRPADLARAVAYSSRYGIDLLTVDAAGGGTGLGPWRMMNECGLPPLELHSLAWQFAQRLARANRVVAPMALAGGFTFEDQIFKGLALGAPFVKLVGMARGPLAAAMVGKTIGNALRDGALPVWVQRFGRTKEEVFVTATKLRQEVGHKEFDQLPAGGVGLYTYFDRLAQGLRQLMAGSRKFATAHLTRDDLGALTPEAARVSGIPHISEVDQEQVDEILKGT